MATYTSAADVDVPAVAATYGWDGVEIEPIHGGAANSSFKASAAQGEFVITFLDNHDQSSAENLAAHTQSLFSLGIPTTQVIPNINQRLVSHISERPVIVKRWIDGQVADPLPDHLLPQVGAVLAQLHNLPTDIPGIPAGTRRLSSSQRSKIADFNDQAFAAWLIERLQQTEIREAGTSFPEVISHGDLFADNIIVSPGGEISIIDWETVCVDTALLDLGMTILGTAQKDGIVVAERANSIVVGYERIRPLSSDDLSILPSTVEHSALIIAFHRYYRHNVRFPDRSKRKIHEEIVDLVQALDLSFESK